MSTITSTVTVTITATHLSGPEIAPRQIIEWARIEMSGKGFTPGEWELFVCPDHGSQDECDVVDCNVTTGHYSLTVDL